MLYLRNTILAVGDRINSRTLVCVYVLHTYVLHTYSEVTVRVTAKDPINLGSMSWSGSKGSGEVLEGLGGSWLSLEEYWFLSLLIGIGFSELPIIFLSLSSVDTVQ